MNFKFSYLSQKFDFPSGNYDLIAKIARPIAIFGLIIYPLLVFFELKIGQRSHLEMHLVAMAFMLPLVLWPSDQPLKKWQKIYWELMVPLCTYSLSFFQYLFDALSQFWIGSITVSAVICGLLCRLRYLPLTIGIAILLALGMMQIAEGYLPMFITYRPGIVVTIPALLLGIGFRFILEKAFYRIREAEKLSYKMHQLEGDEVTLSKFLKTSLVQELQSGKDPLEFEPKFREAGILSCRIRNFAKILSEYDSSTANEVLSGWLSLVHHSSSQYGGEAEKWMGNEVLLAFENKRSAMQTALQIQLFQQDLNRKMIRSGYRKIDFGLGLSWGNVTRCNLGSARRTERTLLGDPVSTSQFLAEKMQIWGSVLTISREFLPTVPQGKKTRLIEQVSFDDKKTISAYEVFSNEPRVVAEYKKQTRDDWHQALQHYEKKEFTKAYSIFRHLEASAPPHLYQPGKPCDLALPEYNTRCIHLIENTPPKMGRNSTNDTSRWSQVS